MLQLFAGSFFPGWAAVLTHVNEWEEKFPLYGTFHRPVLAILPCAPGEASQGRAKSAHPRMLSFLNSGWWEGTRPAHRVR